MTKLFLSLLNDDSNRRFTSLYILEEEYVYSSPENIARKLSLYIIIMYWVRAFNYVDNKRYANQSDKIVENYNGLKFEASDRMYFSLNQIFSQV